MISYYLIISQFRRFLSMATLASIVLAVVGCGSTPTTNKDAKAKKQTEADIITSNILSEYWSNSRIPLLHGMPDKVKSEMSPFQRSLIEKIEEQVKFADEKLPAVKNQFALAELNKELERRESVFAKQFIKELKDAKIHKWVGQIRFTSKDEVELYFGRGSTWCGCGNIVPNAKNGSAFRSEILFHVQFSHIDENTPDVIKNRLKSLEDWDWVEIAAQIVPGEYSFDNIVDPRSSFIRITASKWSDEDLPENHPSNVYVHSSYIGFRYPGNNQNAYHIRGIRKLAASSN